MSVCFFAGGGFTEVRQGRSHQARHRRDATSLTEGLSRAALSRERGRWPVGGAAQPLDAALGQYTLAQQALCQQTLGAMAPTVLENWWNFIVMPPPPSLPDSMVIDKCLVAPAPKLAFCRSGIQLCVRSAFCVRYFSAFELHTSAHTSPAPILR